MDDSDEDVDPAKAAINAINELVKRSIDGINSISQSLAKKRRTAPPSNPDAREPTDSPIGTNKIDIISTNTPGPSGCTSRMEGQAILPLTNTQVTTVESTELAFDAGPSVQPPSENRTLNSCLDNQNLSDSPQYDSFLYDDWSDIDSQGDPIKKTAIEEALDATLDVLPNTPDNIGVSTQTVAPVSPVQSLSGHLSRQMIVLDDISSDAGDDLAALSPSFPALPLEIVLDEEVTDAPTDANGNTERSTTVTSSRNTPIKTENTCSCDNSSCALRSPSTTVMKQTSIDNYMIKRPAHTRTATQNKAGLVLLPTSSAKPPPDLSLKNRRDQASQPTAGKKNPNIWSEDITPRLFIFSAGNCPDFANANDLPKPTHLRAPRAFRSALNRSHFTTFCSKIAFPLLTSDDASSTRILEIAASWFSNVSLVEKHNHSGNLDVSVALSHAQTHGSAVVFLIPTHGDSLVSSIAGFTLPDIIKDNINVAARQYIDMKAMRNRIQSSLRTPGNREYVHTLIANAVSLILPSYVIIHKKPGQQPTFKARILNEFVLSTELDGCDSLQQTFLEWSANNKKTHLLTMMANISHDDYDQDQCEWIYYRPNEVRKVPIDRFTASRQLDEFIQPDPFPENSEAEVRRRQRLQRALKARRDKLAGAN